MKSWKWVIALLALTGCVNVSVHTGGDKHPSPPPQPSAAGDSAVASSVNAFGLDLYRKLASRPGNLTLSPLSISTVLASLTPGTAGKTREQMLHVLHLEGVATEGYRTLLVGLDSSASAGRVTWTAANRAWVQTHMKLLPEFVKTVQADFGYDIGEADFILSPGQSRVAINQWIESKTESRIRDLFPAGSIDVSMRLVLANAIYFKGFWQYPFDREATRPAPFYPSPKQPVSVPMMSRTADLPVAQIAGAHILELPYRGDSLSMLVVLPDRIDGLGALEKRVTADSLRAWSAAVHEHHVLITIPRFRADWRLNLSETLADMGMASAFHPRTADFSKITGGPDLFIAIVMHAAFVDVNEEGTEAAAATGVGMRASVSRMPEETLRADHPFLFLIRDRATGCILFLGRVVDPRA